jgi:hypothetical protein
MKPRLANLVVDDERRAGSGEAVLHRGHLDVVDHLPRLRLERHKVRVEGHHEQAIPMNRKTAIDHAAAHLEALRERPLVMPDLFAGTAVDRPRMIEGAGDVEDAVHNDRRRLELVDDAGLEGPLGGQLIDVGGGDLREGTESLAGVVTRVGQPARGVAKPREQILRRNVLSLHDVTRRENGETDKRDASE